MDYYKNIDILGGRVDSFAATGIQYNVVDDLVDEPVTTAFFKQHARIDFNTDDNLIEAYIKAARIYLEQWSQLSFGVKTISLTALTLPKNFRLMFGRVDTITTTGFTNVGDILKEGGEDVDIEYTTVGIINDTIRIAICRYAAGLYINRETITETKYSGDQKINEAKEMVRPYMNVIVL